MFSVDEQRREHDSATQITTRDPPPNTPTFLATFRGEFGAPNKGTFGYIDTSTNGTAPESPTRHARRLANREAGEANARFSVFRKLPAELLHGINGVLDPVGRQALRLACRAFYHCLPPQQLIEWSTKSNRLSFACMLDRDGMLESTAVCSDCAALHAKSCFSAAELERNHETRQCEGSKRLFYVRPGFTLSAKTLRCQLERCMFDRMQIYCFDDWSCPVDPVPVLKQDPEGRNGYILQRFRLMEFAPRRVPTKQAVADFLAQFNVPICPHIRMGDPRVISQYFLDPFQRLGNNPACTSAPKLKAGKCEVPQCITDYGFSLSGWESRNGGNHYLMLYVIRELGNLDDPNDSTWWAQTTSQVDPGLDEQWMEYDNYRQSQLQQGVAPGITVHWRWGGM